MWRPGSAETSTVSRTVLGPTSRGEVELLDRLQVPAEGRREDVRTPLVVRDAQRGLRVGGP